jgi:hypothetical protein
MKGVPGRQEEFQPAMASYYDLIVGLHPDEATRAVAEAALVCRAIMIPCCNFWAETRLGRYELVTAIESYYRSHSVRCERVAFGFAGPKNLGIVSEPAANSAREVR